MFMRITTVRMAMGDDVFKQRQELCMGRTAGSHDVNGRRPGLMKVAFGNMGEWCLQTAGMNLQIHSKIGGVGIGKMDTRLACPHTKADMGEWQAGSKDGDSGL